MIFDLGDGDTICALSTPPGISGIAMVRASGPRAFEIGKRLCPFLPVAPESHRAYVGVAREPGSREPIDELVVTTFSRGRSFTGDETCEFSCHGSEAIVAALLRELVSAGCRPARPGEFTYRAFANGRLDLVQAEAVLSLIESQTLAASRASLRQLRGDHSKDYRAVQDGIVWALAHLEASIDFSVEGLPTVSYEELSERLNAELERCRALAASYQKGRLISEGAVVALVGEPNSGKSSLLNALLGEDKAIVTAEPGTTRDLVEGRLAIDGALLRIVDTAGIRQTESEAERLGISRSRAMAEAADASVAVLDAAVAQSSRDWIEAIGRIDPHRRASAIVLNKLDLEVAERNWNCFGHEFADAVRAGRSPFVFAVSAKSGVGLEPFRAYLKNIATQAPMAAQTVVIQARHFEQLRRIEHSLVAALQQLRQDSSPEFIAFELREAVGACHELLGERFDEQVIDRIFSEFCLGK